MALFSKIRPLPCPFFFVVVVLENGTLLSAAFMDRWRDDWKSASERPIWSAFNGLERKVREVGGGTVPFFLLFGCCFWNFLSGIIRGADFFLISCDCVYYTWIVSAGLTGCPGHRCSLSRSRLVMFDISQTKWRILNVRHEISERLRVGFSGGGGGAGRAYFKELLCFLAPFWPRFFPRTL